MKLIKYSALIFGFIFVIIGSSFADFIFIKSDLLNSDFVNKNVSFLIGTILLKCIFLILGAYISCKYSQGNPSINALIAGIIGLAFFCLVDYFKVTPYPGWYNITLAVLALPSTIIGVIIYHFLKNRKSDIYDPSQLHRVPGEKF
jgi:hypothetical protein